MKIVLEIKKKKEHPVQIQTEVRFRAMGTENIVITS